MLSIREMTRDDLDRAMDWAAAEGWNPGLDDASAFHAADPAGFLMGFLGDEPVTAISVVAYGAAFGFLGLYICRPEHRGRGFGWQTWQAGMARLGKRVIGLDGVVAQQENYRRSGFTLAHRNIRFGGIVDCETPQDPRLMVVSEALKPAVIAYDAALFPADRAAFLDVFLDGRGGRVAIALVEDGSARGYGVIRPAISGAKIGPLFAESAEDADLLFRALAARAKGATVYFDPPEPNGAALALAARYGLEPAFETARMYRGPAPGLPLDRIFGITSFELG
ncbi:GNAT family N-acetyltransferase [Mesorhizobium sp. BR1-1-16]|uniref:GNAT family N-acetyltransferase n=1 Tax=Mesorhizobium sp. BR1-1-16 TaxID=2876653 RepID=UPI001CCB9C15|nr:GNAT family N-acetyltransferase [Mesorhizobium sp. BR1-1-16]MBZ9936504.1 GNAT family N-acetyltransferase [Mesorhizobium sp. BR1-1-16]